MAIKKTLQKSIGNMTAQNQKLDQKLVKAKKSFDEVSGMLKKVNKKEVNKNGS